MAVGTADEGLCVIEFTVEIFPFLHVLNLNVHREAFGHKLNLMTEALDQHAGVPFDFIKALVMCVEPSLNTIESLIERLKPTIKVLNEFLVHAASAARKGMPLRRSCQ